VEEIIDPAAALESFVVGHVVTCGRHPDADRLSLCTVVDGTKDAKGEPTVYQVVCGAPNVRADMKVAFARAGTVIPSTGVALKKGVIRGIESQGMLCSAAELNLGADSDGILDLDASLIAGTPLTTALAATDLASQLDPIIDVSITPNRSDCFSIRGLARDLAAFGIGTLKDLEQPTITAMTESGITISIDGDHTKHFAMRLIKGVKNGPSPAWIQQRLLSAGCRPISALVDITNLMCLEYGRPMHVFDAAKLNSAHLHLSLSHGGEALAALNDKDYILPAGAIIITDGLNNANGAGVTAQDKTSDTNAAGASDMNAAHKTQNSTPNSTQVISLAGIMGGRETAVDENTTDVLLESALFDAARIASAGQRLSLLSDARTRFERGVDAADVLPGLDRATQMILDICGGQPCAVVQQGAHANGQPAPQPVTLHLARLHAVTGNHALTLDMAASYLTKLGCTMVSADAAALTVTAPSHRHDLMIEADLIEEVLRLHGYDNIPEAKLPLHTPVDMPNTRSSLSTYFTNQGYSEAYTWAFVSAPVAALFGQGVALDKPLNADMAVMRPSVLPGLLRIAGNAQKRSQPNSTLMEAASQFHQTTAPDGTSHIQEKRTFSGLRVFSKGKRHWKGTATAPDFFVIKNEVLNALSLFGVNNVQIDASGPSYYHPGRVATLRQGKTVLALFGEIHPKVLQTMDVAGTCLGFEILLDALPGEISLADILPIDAQAKKKSAPKAFASATLQSMTRDFAFWVDAAVTAGQITSLIQKVDRALITAVDVFDVYTGDKAPEGQKSVAVEVTLQPLKQTLSLEEVADLQSRITVAVSKGCGGRLRDAG
jgi:phenylalanyl-tRNA synthetase beta chain